MPSSASSARSITREVIKREKRKVLISFVKSFQHNIILILIKVKDKRQKAKRVPFSFFESLFLWFSCCAF